MLLTLLLALNAHANEIYGQTLKPREAKAYEYDKVMNGRAHDDTSFTVDATPVIQDGKLILHGTLANPGPSRKTVYLEGQDDPFTIDVIDSAQVSHAHQVNKPTPSMFDLDLPARSRTEFTATLPLSELKYSGTPRVQVKWKFHFWTDPKPNGTTSVVLPTPDATTVPPIEVAIEKFSSDSSSGHAMINAQLKNVSATPQTFCADAVKWTLKNPDGAEPSRKRETSASPVTCFTIAPGTEAPLAQATLAKETLTAPTITYSGLHGAYTLTVEAQNHLPAGATGPASARGSATIAIP